MENNCQKNYKDDNSKNELKNIKNNRFTTFMEDYYGFFKNFIEAKDLYEIGKINRKLMSLFLIDKGNKLYLKKESKKNILKQILSVSIYNLFNTLNAMANFQKKI